MRKATGTGWKAGAVATCLTLLGAPLAAAEDDVFDPDAKPTFRKLAPETTGGDFYYSAEFQPDIVIRDEPGAMIEEFSTNGNTYMMRVTPRNAPPYYLVDSTGNGRFGWRRGGLSDDIRVPGWAIASW